MKENYLNQKPQTGSNIRKNKKVRSVLQILLSLSLLAYFISRAGLESVLDELITIDFSWYLPAFLLFQLNVIIRAYRWFILLNSLNKQSTFGHLLYLYFLGFFANNFIPSGFGGDVVKVVNVRQHYGRGAEALSSVMMDRLTGLLGTSVIALGALALNALGHTADIHLPTGMWIAIAVLSLGIPLGFLFLRWIDVLTILERLFPTIRRLPRYDSLRNLVNTVHRYPLPVLLKALLISLPFTINLVLIQFSVARALDVTFPLTIFFLFAPVISIVNLLPIAFNGLGTREAIYQLLFLPLGVPLSSVLAMSLAYYFLRFFTGLIGGSLYAIRTVLHILRTPKVKH